MNTRTKPPKRKTINPIVRQAFACFLAMLVVFSTPAQLWAASPTKAPAKTSGTSKAAPVAPTQPATSVPAKAMSAKARAAKAVLVRSKKNLPAKASDLDLLQVRGLPEPIIQMNSKPVAGENDALAKAITDYKAKANPEDVSDLISFTKSFPSSRWTPSLSLNIGLLRYQTGYLTDAMSFWKSAWEGSKSETQNPQTTVAENAISQLMILEARLGRKDQLKKHFAELGSRGMHGSSASRLYGAKGGLHAMDHAEATSFKCGPLALNSILYKDQQAKGLHPILKAASSTSKGTNLAQVMDWSQQVGLSMQMAKRSKGAVLVLPAVAHWRLGHFGAIISESKGRYRVDDPTFDQAGMTWLSKQAIDTESDGYFLVPAGALPQGWQSVSRAEAQTVWGKGIAHGRDPGKCPSQPKNPPCITCPCPMAVPSAWTMQAELNIQDYPLSYNVPVGPDISFLANFNQNETGQPTFNFTNLGDWWTLNWVSWISVPASNQAMVHVRGGGVEVYNYTLPDNVTNPYPPNLTSQAVLTIAGTGVYQRLLPDGSIEVFGLTDGTNFYMTQVIDAQGNVATINWDTTNFRVLSITDATGQPTTFNYVSNTVGNSGYYKIASIVDPSGRTATFAFDSTNTYLQSITDPAGIVSQFAYASGSNFITTLTSPYGATSFYSYVPAGEAPYPPQGLRTIYPDGSMSVIENWIDEPKMTYAWDREAMAAYPQDPINHIYSHATNYKFLWQTATNNESPVINYVKRPLESPVVSITEGEQGRDFEGTSNLATTVMRSLSGQPVKRVALGGTVAAGDVYSIIISDMAITGTGAVPINYTAKGTDTLTTIASSLAALVNNDALLPAAGISAVANGSTVLIQSLSANNTTVVADVIARPPSETVALASSTVTIGGTATQNDTIEIEVINTILPTGKVTVIYTVPLNTTPVTDMAAGIAALINGNTTLTSNGFSASSVGSVIYLSSLSAGTTYTATAKTTAKGTATASTNGTSATIGAIANTNVVITDSALGGGSKTISYTTQTGDTLASVAAGLANNINLDSSLQTLGISAISVGPVLTVQSLSANSTTYSSSAGTVTFGSTNVIQTSNYQYNAFGKVTQSIDPVGRTFQYRYSANNVDLMEVRETKGSDNFLLGKWQYNEQHLPTQYINGSGQKTQYAYNPVGQMTTRTNALSSQTTRTYNIVRPITIGGTFSTGRTITITINGVTASFGPTVGGQTLTTIADGLATNITALGLTGVTAINTGTVILVQAPVGSSWSSTTQGAITVTMGTENSAFLTQVDGPLNGNLDIGKLSWNFAGTISSATNSQGYKLLFDYDNLDRLTKVTYPDATTDQIAYQNLDPIFFIDRLGRTTTAVYDSLRRLVQETDPLGRATKYTWCTCGAIATLTDPLGQITTWNHDLEGRVTQKVFQDASQINYVYLPSISLVYKRTDALNQKKFFNYNIDNSLAQLSYADEVNSTSDVYMTYDQTFPRLTSAQNAWGTNSYAYNAYITDPFASYTSGIFWLQGWTTTNDNVNMTITNPSLTAGAPYNFVYQVQAADTTLAKLATSIKNAINANSTLSTAGISATSNSAAVTVLGTGTTTVSANTTGGANGATEYASGTIPSVGAGRLQQASNTVIANSAATYSFDPLGRTINRSINGSANSSDWTFDPMGRMAGEVNPLCSSGTQFGFTYLDQGPPNKGDLRVSQIAYPNGQASNFKYFSTTYDERLKEIQNLDPSLNGLSQFNYDHDSAGQITNWLQQQKTNQLNYMLGYDAAGQLSSAQAGAGGTTVQPFVNQSYFGFDKASNRTSVQSNNGQVAAVSGTGGATDQITITVTDPALSAPEAVVYTISGTPSASAMADNLAEKITSNTNLQNVGISATPNGSVVNLKSKTGNMTTYAAAITGSAGSEKVVIGMNTVVENISLTGTLTHNDVVSITVYDPALTSNPSSVTHTVDTGPPDTIKGIAGILATALGGLSNSNISITATANPNSATSVGVITAQVTKLTPSNSGNIPIFTTSVTGAKTESITAAPSLNGSITGVIAGSTTGNDLIKLTVLDKGLTNGQKTISYTVVGGHTPTQNATGFVAVINADTDLQKIGVTASSSSANFTLTSCSTNATNYVPFTSNSGATLPGTETIVLGLPPAGVQTATVGTPAQNDQVNFSIYDASLAGGSKSITPFTIPASPTVNSVATSLKGAIDALGLSPAITTVVVNGTVNITSTTQNITTYESSISGGGTTTVKVSPSVGVTQYGYGSDGMNQLQSIAAGGAVRFQGTTDRAVQPVTMNSGAITADMLSSKSFSANPVLTTGLNTETVKASSDGSNFTTNTYKITAAGPSSKTLTNDANGNMTSDGTNTYAWDAEDRLIQVTYPGTGNNTQFTYDAFGNRVKIVETVASSVTSTKQHLWCGSRLCEEYDGAAPANLVTQFFKRGYRNGGNSFYYGKPHIGSITEVTNSSGAIVAQVSFSPYGERTLLQGSALPDWGYAGYYYHGRSQLNLTRTRAYSASLGRFISRDPIAEAGGVNLYAYVGGNPISFTDSSGLQSATAAGSFFGLPGLVAGGLTDIIIWGGGTLIGGGIVWGALEAGKQSKSGENSGGFKMPTSCEKPKPLMNQGPPVKGEGEQPDVPIKWYDPETGELVEPPAKYPEVSKEALEGVEPRGENSPGVDDGPYNPESPQSNPRAKTNPDNPAAKDMLETVRWWILGY